MSIEEKNMLEFTNKYVIGNSVPIVLVLTGIFFLIFLRGKPMSTPKKMLKAMFKRRERGIDGQAVSPFRSMTMALAGTLGVGNIVGVASAIALGGFGAVFWMWISALAAMILKYSEIVLAIAHRKSGKGGAIYYIRGIFNRLKLYRTGKIIAAVFGALCILNSLSMGCIVQVNAVSSAMNGVLGVPKWAVGLALSGLTAAVITKGSKKISGLTEWLVPVMSIGYIGMSVAVMVICRDRLPDALSLIFKEAFDLHSVGGGVLGFLAADGIRYGSMRGLLSNEAGCGTAPFAHATSGVTEPAEQGVWGIFEVFADTVLLCTMTAAVIILNYEGCCAFSGDGVMMTVRAFSLVLGDGAAYFLCLAIFLFAYATVICWAQYGAECVTYLASGLSASKRSRIKYAYFFIFCLCAFAGTLIAPSSVWSVADFSIGSMTLINVFVLYLGAVEVKGYTDRVFGKKLGGSYPPSVGIIRKGGIPPHNGRQPHRPMRQ